MRAKISRGEARKFPTGPKPRDPSITLKRKLRAQALRSPTVDDAAWEARFLAVVLPHGGARPPWPRVRDRSQLAVLLERLERTFITRLNDPDPPPPEVVEKAYDDIRQYEELIDPVDGKPERLARLAWERHAWHMRLLAAEMVPAAAAPVPPVEREEPSAPTAGQTPLGNQTTPENNQTMGAPPVDDVTVWSEPVYLRSENTAAERARAFSRLIVEAGMATGVRKRGGPVEREPRPLTIAPSLYRP